MKQSCWLAANGVYERGLMPSCAGRLVRCHLIPRSLLEREFRSRGLAVQALVADPRSWVWGCGGAVGNGAHHGMLDQAKTLRIPRERLPAGLEAFADELGLGWWLDREYGPASSLSESVHRR